MHQLITAAGYFGVNLTSAQLEQFRLYRDELISWNRLLNLTAIVNPEDIEIKHFADSLSVLGALDRGLLEDSPDVIDVGTGAGFPGIPLKIAFPGIHLTLLDSTKKKMGFIQHIITKLGLDNVSTLTGRAEEIAHDPFHRAHYQLVLSRAVAKLSTLAEFCLPFCSINGRFVSYKKGDIQEEVEASRDAIHILGGTLIEVTPVLFPALADARYIIITEKVSSTPPKYPRRPGIPLKNPL